MRLITTSGRCGRRRASRRCCRTSSAPSARPATTWRQDRALPPFEAGDLIAVMTAGAYGAVMSSTYNTRPLVPEVLVNGERHAIVRPRVSVEQLIALDRVPAWLD